jgi:ribosomal protein S28E/S33
MSDSIDWTATATMLERDDSGSDRDVDFRTVCTGALADLVARVVCMLPAERARIIIDRGVHGTIGVNDIMLLASRADYPGV